MFFIVILVALAAAHVYLWKRFVADLGLTRRARRIGAVVFALLGLMVPVTLSLRRAGNGVDFGLVKALTWPGIMWLGLVFLGSVAMGLTDLARLLLWLAWRRGAGRDAPASPARRRFLARTAAGAAATLTGGGVVAGMASALGRVAVKQIEVPLRRLPQALDGTRIVQLTDVHVGPTIGRAFIEEIVARVNALAPDVVAITGDLVDARPPQIRDALAPLADLRPRWGTYFVTGNHEYYAGVHAWMPEIEQLGIRILRNERVTVGHGDAVFDLAGTDDYSAAHLASDHGEDIPRALRGRDPSRPVVLLAHQPRSVREAARHGVDLQLSGHTHGGQIWPWRYMVSLQQPVVRGLARHEGTWVYVSCGTGYLGPPLRLFAPAEITNVVLRCG